MDRPVTPAGASQMCFSAASRPCRDGVPPGRSRCLSDATQVRQPPGRRSDAVDRPSCRPAAMSTLDRLDAAVTCGFAPRRGRRALDRRSLRTGGRRSPVRPPNETGATRSGDGGRDGRRLSACSRAKVATACARLRPSCSTSASHTVRCSPRVRTRAVTSTVPGLAGTQIGHGELTGGGHVAVLDGAPDRRPHGGVHERGEDPAVQRARRVEVLLPGLEADACRPVVGRVPPPRPVAARSHPVLRRPPSAGPTRRTAVDRHRGRPEKSCAACRSGRRSFDVSVERGRAGRGDRPPLPHTGRSSDALHGDRQGQRGLRERRHAHRAGARRDGRLQRGAGQGRRHAGRRGPAPELEGCAGPLRQGRQRTVVDGPFAETKELVAGFWILEVSSREEVIEWAKKIPFRDGEVEIRQVFTAEEFGDAMTPELQRAGGPDPGDRRSSARLLMRELDGVGDGTASSTPSGAWSPRSSIAALTRVTGDVGLAEELAQDALVAALERWPESGVPDKPGAWLMATAKHRAIDTFRRAERLERKTAELGRELAGGGGAGLGRRAGRGGRGRPAPAGLHLLPPGALARGPGGAHPPAARRSHHRRDRPRVPRRRADGRAADRPREADADRRARAVRGADRPGLHRPARLGARGDLPGLQRGLRGDVRPGLGPAGAVPGGHAARPHPRRADAGGVRRCTAWSP